MKLQRLLIKQYKCIPELEIRPKAVTVVEGGNGRGKTSVLDALSLIFDGGHRPQDIRNGAKKAEISIEIEDDRGGVFTVAKTINQKSSSIVVTKPDGEPAESPQTWLKELASGIGFDPVTFCEDPKARAEWIQKAMPITFTVQEATKTIYGDGVAAILKRHITGPVDLQGLIEARQRIYDERTKQNGVLKQTAGAKASLKAALPPDGDSKDWAAEGTAASAELDDLARQKLGKLRTVDGLEKDEIQAKTDECQKQIDALILARDAEIESIRMQSRRARTDIEEEFSGKEAAARERRTQAQERASEATRVATLRGEYERALREHTQAESAAANMNDALDSLDDLRKRKLKEMPIEGAEVRDGQLFINELPYDNLSTSEKLRVAFQFAGLMPNKLPMMISDRAESFEESNWQEVKAAAVESGYQVFFARVTEGELAVETI